MIRRLRGSEMPGPSNEFSYGGTDNLEAMREATSYNRFLTDSVELFSGESQSWLDFGAGIGTFAEMLRDRGRSVDCLEPDPSLAGMLNNKGFRTFGSSEGIASETYDYVYSLNVFEHIEQHLSAAREACRILRPGGRLFIYVPAFQFLFGAMDRKVGHYRRYTKSSLSSLVRESGFTVQKVGYADSLGVVATLLFNLVSTSEGSIGRRSVTAYDSYVFPLSRLIDRMACSVIGKNVFVVARKVDE